MHEGSCRLHLIFDAVKRKKERKKERKDLKIALGSFPPLRVKQCDLVLQSINLI